MQVNLIYINVTTSPLPSDINRKSQTVEADWEVIFSNDSSNLVESVVSMDFDGPIGRGRKSQNKLTERS